MQLLWGDLVLDIRLVTTLLEDVHAHLKPSICPKRYSRPILQRTELGLLLVELPDRHFHFDKLEGRGWNKKTTALDGSLTFAMVANALTHGILAYNPSKEGRENDLA